MKTKSSLKINILLVLLTLLLAPDSFGYVQNATNILAPGPNLIEKSATTLTLATFQPAVTEAWSNNLGGVFNFPTGITPSTNRFQANFGTNGYHCHITSSATMQNITAGTFTLASAPNGTTSSANNSDYTLTLSIVDTNTGLPAIDQIVKQIGFVFLSRTAAGYPLDLRVTVTYSDDSTDAVTSPIANGAGVDDTFFGFAAPNGLAIKSVRLQSFVSGTETPVSDRMGWDDFGFIAGSTTATPQPLILNASPAPFAIADAVAGIQFNALTYETANTNNISLTLNEVDVSSQLVFAGDPTNYLVSFNGLTANQEYSMTINVTNSSGTATLTRTFYTYTNSQTLYDSEGFSDEILYPIGNLQPVAHGRGTWVPHPLEPATIVDAGGAQGKVLERAATGASRPDYLAIPPFSSGTITYEFDAFVSTAAARTIDVCLQPTTGGNAMASFIAWGQIPGKLAYFDNVNWIALSDIEVGWHNVKIINYLSGLAAGKYDVLINGISVAQKIPWRNPITGAAFNQIRIQTQDTASIFQYGQVDNLVVKVEPEDPNIFLPPTILNLTPANNSMAHPPTGVQFDISSEVPLATSNIVLRLNGNPVTLNFTGPSTLLTASHTNLATGNYSGEIQATNEAGVTTVNFTFVVTDEPWLVDPDAQWVGPWQWTSGGPLLGIDVPLDGAGPYIHLNTTGTIRNFMRQYKPGPVDITQPHFIRWKFRLIDPDFNNFGVFNDRVHFFGRNGSRLAASTDASVSWSIMAAGAANAGAVGGKTFWVFDNVEGNGTFNLANHVDTSVPLVPGDVYSFEVLVHPAERTFSVSISNETSTASFTSAAPHRFRNLTAAGTAHTYLHFGLQTSGAAESRAFDFDSVFISPSGTHAATLFAPVRTASTFSFSFWSQNGINHFVQFKNDLNAPTWTPLETIPGDGTIKTVIHNNPPAGNLFYQIESQ